MTDTRLLSALRDLVGALNARDARAARALCAHSAWDHGALPVEPLCRDEFLTLQVAPTLLESDGRAAARILGLRADKTRESLWFLLERGVDGWRCVEATRTRLDADGFLTGKRTPAAPPLAPAAAPPTPVRPATDAPDAALERSGLRLVEALAAADADVVRALTEEGHYGGPGQSPERLIRFLRQSPSKVTVTEWRVRGDRAAARLAMRAEQGTDEVWAVWRRRSGLGWKLVAVPRTWEPAGLFLTGRTAEVPGPGTLAADVGATRWADEVLAAAMAASDAPPGIPERAFRDLTRPPDTPGHVLRMGQIASLPALGRAIVTIDVVDPATDFALDSRHALLERADAEAAWAFRRTTDLAGLAGLLDGITIAWDDEVDAASSMAPAAGAAAEPPSEVEAATRQALLDGVRGVLRANGLDAADIAVDAFSTEELRGLLPQLFGGVASSLLTGLLGQAAGALEGSAPAPDDAISRDVRSALREALHSANEDGVVTVDARLVAEQGPKLLGSLFGAVAKALGPAVITVNSTPVEGQEPVSMPLDLGQMLGALFEQAARASSVDADPTEE